MGSRCWRKTPSEMERAGHGPLLFGMGRGVEMRVTVQAGEMSRAKKETG